MHEGRDALTRPISPETNKLLLMPPLHFPVGFSFFSFLFFKHGQSTTHIYASHPPRWANPIYAGHSCASL